MALFYFLGILGLGFALYGKIPLTKKRVITGYPARAIAIFIFVSPLAQFYILPSIVNLLVQKNFHPDEDITTLVFKLIFSLSIAYPLNLFLTKLRSKNSDAKE